MVIPVQSFSSAYLLPAWHPYLGVPASLQSQLLHDLLDAGPLRVLVDLIHLEGGIELKLLQNGQRANEKIILLHGINCGLELHLVKWDFGNLAANGTSLSKLAKPSLKPQLPPCT